MTPVTITGKRAFRRDGKDYLECYCNGHHLIGDGPNALAQVQNSCRLIKAFGAPSHRLMFGSFSAEEQSVLRSTSLPEWDE